MITLVAITVERYCALIYALGNKGNLTTRKLKVCHNSFKKYSIQQSSYSCSVNKIWEKNIDPAG